MTDAAEVGAAAAIITAGTAQAVPATSVRRLMPGFSALVAVSSSFMEPCL